MDAIGVAIDITTLLYHTCMPEGSPTPNFCVWISKIFADFTMDFTKTLLDFNQIIAHACTQND